MPVTLRIWIRQSLPSSIWHLPRTGSPDRSSVAIASMSRGSHLRSCSRNLDVGSRGTCSRDGAPRRSHSRVCSVITPSMMRTCRSTASGLQQREFRRRRGRSVALEALSARATWHAFIQRFRRRFQVIRLVRTCVGSVPTRAREFRMDDLQVTDRDRERRQISCPW